MEAEKRQKFIEELRNFTGSHSIKLQQICNDVGWSVDQLYASKKNDECATCPLDIGHLVQQNKLNDHIFKCKWKKEGYSNEDFPFPGDFTQGGMSITLSQAEHAAVIQAASKLNPSIPSASLATVPEVPQSTSRFLSSFTPKQRLALYEHVVQRTSVNTASGLQLTELDLAFEAKRTKTEEPKSFLEVLAEQRDAKRRRLNYRQAKHVHTKHKSQAEVTREVIENQMELYKEWLQQQNGESDDSKIDKPCGSLDEVNTSEAFHQSSGTKSKDIETSCNQETRSSSYEEDCKRDKHRSSSRHSRDKSDLKCHDNDHSRNKNSGRHRDYKSSHSNRPDKGYKSHSNRFEKDKKSISDRSDRDDHKERDSYSRGRKEKKHSSSKRHHSHSSGHHKHSKKSKYSDEY